MTPDCELLRCYTEDHSEKAFADLASRHVDLVYSAALRQVNGDAHLAQDITQTVFSDLARKAAQLSSRKDLAGWLYTSACFAATKAVRTESRRRVREQEAQTMHDLLQSPVHEPEWETLRPVLDQAMNDLDEPDREAVVLRYFQNSPHAIVGERLGIGEDAARMRVERALEKLRNHLSRRGITTSAAALSIVISANAVQAAPVGLALTISTAAVLTGTTLATTATATATKAIAMTTLQKTLVTATVVAVGTGIFEARQASTLNTQVQMLQQQQAPLAEQIGQLQQERDDAIARQAALEQENARLKETVADVPKLRGELARLRTTQPQQAQSKTAGTDTNDPEIKHFLEFKAQAMKIAQLLEQMPDKKIPELQFLADEDWLVAVKLAKFDSETDIRKTLSKLRSLAKAKMPMGWALSGFIRAHDGELPTDLSQLKPYFKTPTEDESNSRWRGVDPVRDDATLDAILARYKLLHTGNIKDLDPKAWLIVEKAPVDKDYDTRGKFGNGYSTLISTGIGEAGDPDDKSY